MRLVAPLAQNVGLCAAAALDFAHGIQASRRGRPEHRADLGRSSRAGASTRDRRSSPVPARPGRRELRLAPPVRHAGDRGTDLILAKGLGHLLEMGRFERLPEPMPRRSPGPARASSAAPWLYGSGKPPGLSSRSNIDVSPARVTQAKTGSSLSASPVSGFLWPRSAVADSSASSPILGSNIAAGPPPEGSRSGTAQRRPPRETAACSEARSPRKCPVSSARRSNGPAGRAHSGSNSLVSSRVSSNKLRSGPYAASRSPSRTRLTPDRARRSASCSACSPAEKRPVATGILRRTALAPCLRNVRCPSLTVTDSSTARPAASSRNDTSSALLGRDRTRRWNVQPIIRLIGDLVRRPGPGGGIGRSGDPHVVEPDRADPVELFDLKDRPDARPAAPARWPCRPSSRNCPTTSGSSRRRS